MLSGFSIRHSEYHMIPELIPMTNDNTKEVDTQDEIKITKAVEKGEKKRDNCTNVIKMRVWWIEWKCIEYELYWYSCELSVNKDKNLWKRQSLQGIFVLIEKIWQQRVRKCYSKLTETRQDNKCLVTKHSVQNYTRWSILVNTYFI